VGCVDIRPSTTCFSRSGCQEVLGEEILGIARSLKQSNFDSQVQQDTGAESFECLILQIAYVESGIQQCSSFQEDGDPLYCENNFGETLAGDGGDSLGTMQINTAEHQINAVDFETNIRSGVQILVDGYDSDSRTYICNSESYSGWRRALRQYNGWPTTDNIDCNQGTVNYVEEVISAKSEVANLFPQCG